MRRAVSWFERNDRFEIEELVQYVSASIFNMKILSPPKSIQNDSGACAQVSAGLLKRYQIVPDGYQQNSIGIRSYQHLPAHTSTYQHVSACISTYQQDSKGTDTIHHQRWPKNSLKPFCLNFLGDDTTTNFCFSPSLLPNTYSPLFH